jgi:hypothetical protein
MAVQILAQRHNLLSPLPRQALVDNGYRYVCSHGMFDDELWVHQTLPNLREVRPLFAHGRLQCIRSWSMVRTEAVHQDTEAKDKGLCSCSLLRARCAHHVGCSLGDGTVHQYTEAKVDSLFRVMLHSHHGCSLGNGVLRPAPRPRGGGGATVPPGQARVHAGGQDGLMRQGDSCSRLMPD